MTSDARNPMDAAAGPRGGGDTALARTTAAANAPAPPTGKRKRSIFGTAWRVFLWLLLALVLLLALAGGALYWWSGSDRSLQTALQQAGKYMPEGMSLETEGVTGSLQRGGHVDSLKLKTPSLDVDVQNLDLDWDLSKLTDKQVKVGKLNAGKVVLSPKTVADAVQKEPGKPLESLELPVDVELPFKIDEIEWASKPPVQVTDLSGLYEYKGGHHRLRVDGVDVADGHYSAKVDVQGAAPMAIDAELHGRIKAPVPEGAAPLTVLADATVKGTLSGPDARLRITANVAPEDTANAAAGQAMRGNVNAEIAPWAAQPVLQADGDFANVDVARLVPGAPHTLLSGTLKAGPVASAVASGSAPRMPSGASIGGTAGSNPPVAGATGAAGSTAAPATAWQGEVDLRNADAGPYDQKKVPVDRLQARARYEGNRAILEQATIDIGPGRIEAAGSWAPAPEPWQASATITNLIPLRLYSELDATAIDGKLEASQQGDTIDFDVGLKSRGGAKVAGAKVAGANVAEVATTPSGSAKARNADSALGGLRVDEVVAQGTFQGQTLTLKKLRVDAEQARLEGNARAQIDKLAGGGKIDLVLPGASLNFDGDIARTSGAGSVDLKIQNAATLQRWVEGLPGLSSVFAGLDANGSATLDARYKGGWETLQKQLQAKDPAAAAKAGPTFQLDAKLAVPTLDLRLPPPAAKEVADAAKAAAQTVTSPPGQPAKPAAPESVAAASTIKLRDVRLDVSGGLAGADLSLKGEVNVGTQKIVLDTRAHGGATGAEKWRVRLDSLRLSALDTTKRPGTKPWTIHFDQPLTADLRRVTASSGGGAPRLEVEATAGSATLGGPVPGTAKLQWQPIRFVQIGNAAAGQPAFRLRTEGKLLGVPMSWADAFGADAAQLAGYGISGDLVFDANWDIDIGDSVRARVSVARASGDLRLRTGGTGLVKRIHSYGIGTKSETTIKYETPSGDGAQAAEVSTPAGIRKAELVVDAQGDAVTAKLVWDTERAGQIHAEVGTRLVQQDGGWALPADPPLSGRLKADLPNIGVWSAFAPPGWRVQGTLAADATLKGTLHTPQYSGSIRADDLAVKAAVEGIDLRDGRLRATLAGNKLRLDEFVLHGGPANSARIGGRSGNLSTVASEAARGGGELTARGSVSWGTGSAGTAGAPPITMAVDVDIRRMRLLVRTDRQASVSGQLKLGLDKGQVTVRGKLTVDRAVIILPDETAPSLGTDVVVMSKAKAREAAKAEEVKRAREAKAKRAEDAAAAGGGNASVAAAKPPDVSVQVDLGQDFAVQGLGITTRLEGQITIISNAASRGEPRITGAIRTVEGRYRAYGQALNIETGIIRFNGPATNPSLDILAVRPNIAVTAGVQITGSATAPRVKLYSNPAMSDAETLSWVVLGRSTANGGAEAAIMQQAALALLSGLGPSGGGGNFASRFGLDEIGFKGPGEGSDVRGSAITLGKRLSKDFYVTYERSLSGALGTLNIFYDLTKRLTLRAQTGSTSGLDLIYTVSFD
ncbi:MAG: translocation/assembly module TamB domain-containing protein [Variovorax sp.]